MNNNTNNIKKYLLALIGLFLVLYYIWFRFVRERLPRDIPFVNSYLTLMFLTLICLTYIYIILRLLKPKTPSKFILNLLVHIQKVYKPFLILDEILRDSFIFSFIIDCILSFIYLLIKKYNYYIFQLKNKDEFYFIIIIIPKMILLSVFCIDIFYFHQIKYLYYFLWLSFLPLILRYTFYLIKKHTSIKIQNLDSNFYTIPLKINKNESDAEGYLFSLDNVLNIQGFMNTKFFIELQASSLTLLCDLYNYDCVETPEAREKFAQKYNIKLPPIYVGEPRNDEVSIALSKEYFKWMPIVIYVSAFFEEQELFYKENKKKLDKMTIITLTLYLICWLYILLVTLSQENLLSILEVLNIILKNIDKDDPKSSTPF